MSGNPLLPNLGVIEGFYGSCWSHEERLAMVGFLSAKGFLSYCYAPKSDGHLRDFWQKPWANKDFEKLEHIADHARSKNINFSVGLTPLDLHKHWGSGSPQRSALKQKLQQIKSLRPAGISILFDDMWGSDDNLAAMQVDISHFIADELGVQQVCVCPSYYSFDPLLETLFGTKPNNYWQQLGSGMDAAIDLYWTGDSVISERYEAAGLQRISELFRRKPVIWDNSRVNDGRKTSPFLPVKSMPDIAVIADECAGFIVNPMNAANLAQLVLSTLCIAGDDECRLQQVLQQVGDGFFTDFWPLLSLLNDVGLAALSVRDMQQLKTLIERHPSLYTCDIADWLSGKFVFDSACLT